MKKTRPLVSLEKALFLMGLASFGAVTQAWAHAFIDRTEPLVGSTIQASPPAVNLWFTEGLEATFSRVQVFDAAGNEVDKKDVQVDPKNERHLSVSLSKSLATGTYKVVWHAVSVDTHVTDGDFTFGVKP